MNKRHIEKLIKRIQFAIQNVTFTEKLMKEMEKPDDEEIPIKKKNNNRVSKRPKE